VFLRYQQNKYKDCYPGVKGTRDLPFFFWLHLSDLKEHWQSQQRNWDGPKLHVDVFAAPLKDGSLENRFLILSTDVKDAGPELTDCRRSDDPPNGNSERPRAESCVKALGFDRRISGAKSHVARN